MFLQSSSRSLRMRWSASKSLGRLAVARAAGVAHYPSPSPSPSPSSSPSRRFHDTRPRWAVKPVLLADIGEGIVECEVIQWFVEPGASVEEFSPLCEVQSDKASVEITSRFSGTVKKLYYEAGDMARVGKPFVDIDIQGGAKKEDLDALTAGDSATPEKPAAAEPPTNTAEAPAAGAAGETMAAALDSQAEQQAPKQKGKCAALATPAVRHLSKEHKVDISEIDGTGKDGRVLKEDIYKFVKQRDDPQQQQKTAPQQPTPGTPGSPAVGASQQTESRVPLTNTQLQMFKTMTRSLTIPHFLYADEVDFTSLVELRSRLNRVLANTPELRDQVSKLSYLPFIIKAVSMSLNQHPILNARVDAPASGDKPALIMRSQHNIGVAMDTPTGLLVPVIKDVGSLNILSIAAELARLQDLAFNGKLSAADMSGGTITVSNIGNIGGTYVSPVIVEREVAILGIGRMRAVPAFNDAGDVVKKHVTNFSWSADHRVVDGATMARAADVVRKVVEEPDVMVMHLR